MANTRPESDIIAQVRAEIREALAYFSLDSRLADDIAAASANRIKKLLCGKDLYIAKHSKAERRQRREAIRAEFDGRNHDAVCRRYRISRSTLFRATSPKPNMAEKFPLLRLLIKIKARNLMSSMVEEN